MRPSDLMRSISASRSTSATSFSNCFVVAMIRFRFGKVKFGGFITTKTQRTRKLHKESHLRRHQGTSERREDLSRKGAKKALLKRGSALRLCAFAREIFSVEVLF